MFAVIFRAEINQIDEEYHETASRMRELAINEYGCVGFTSVTEGDKEISISYWENQQKIIEWKQDREHMKAQRLGREKWYRSYKVEVVEVRREYGG
jgi:heme-degrading monooxygenase HmoA